MLARLADGPLADREIEIDEPRPTIEIGQDAQLKQSDGAGAHRYRLADVELRSLPHVLPLFRRVAVYVYAPDGARGALGRMTGARAA